jgi:hypothetical protein
VTYDDGGVACTDEALVIRRYYFPFGAKRIPYAGIADVRRIPLTGMRRRYRLWGRGDFVHWYNLDTGRPGKSVAFIIEVTGKNVRPVITPSDADSVAAELTAHGVNVTSD